MDLENRAFRNALGEFATGVAAVTTVGEDGQAIGLTVNSFSSVSLDPPLVLWCLDKGSDTLPAFSNCSGFTINILSAAQQSLSNKLATQGNHGLEGVSVSEGVNGCAKVDEALATFECEIAARHDAGDHIILVGKVVAFDRRDAQAPLIYHRGAYCALAG
ncbi:MAG: flavin reductase family protein [Parvibaculaceae bacterium]